MQTITMPNGDRIYVKPWDANATYRFQNLSRLGPAGDVKWCARLPENSGPDCFVSVREEEGVLVGTTWSGCAITLDAETGEHMRSTFVK